MPSTPENNAILIDVHDYLKEDKFMRDEVNIIAKVSSWMQSNKYMFWPSPEGPDTEDPRRFHLKFELLTAHA